jgi:hypothetical protein
MTDAATVHTEANLRQIFANMEPDRAQTIRECYYEAVQALRCLAESLESADLEVPGSQEFSSRLRVRKDLLHSCEMSSQPSGCDSEPEVTHVRRGRLMPPRR